MKRALLFLYLSACAAEPAAPAEPGNEAAPVESVRWVRAEPVTHLSWLDAPARALIPADARALVSAPLRARVIRVRVRAGETVTAGQPVVDVVIPELITAAGALSAATIRLKAFEQRHRRLAALLDQGLARSAEVAELEAQMALARADRESARATLRTAGISDEQAVGSLAAGGTTSLRAPIAGVVTQVSATVGEVREPTSGPLVELAQRAVAQIEARFSIEPPAELAFEWVEAGRSVPLALDAVSPAASGEAGTRTAWLHAENPTSGPAPGAIGRVRMVPPAHWAVVPLRALRKTREGYAVQTEAGTETKFQTITLVMQSSSDAVIDGVQVGARIALNAQAPSEVTP